MSWEPSNQNPTSGRHRAGARKPKAVRRGQARAVALRPETPEVLEARALLAVLPTTAYLTGGTVDVSNSEGDESTPSIAVDQNNPQRMGAIWTRNDPKLAPGPTEIVEAAVSTDGGQSWSRVGLGGFIFDPTSSKTAPTIFAQASDATAAFDHNDNLYFLYSQHQASNAAGALLLTKYNFATGAATETFADKVVYEWTVDPAFNPTLAVDNSLPSFTDTDVNGGTHTQSDPNSGNVYVAWASQDTAPAYVTVGPGYNPNRIEMVASSDGGNNFGGEQIFSGGNFGVDRNSQPRITISQGSAPRKAGTDYPKDPGTTGTAPGLVNVVYDDFGSGSTATPPFDVINANRTNDDTFTQSFAGQGGVITPGGMGTPNVPMVSDFPVNVSVTNPRFLSVTNLTVNLAITHPSIAELSVTLIPPTGSGLKAITLLENQTDAAGTSNTGVGASGTNLGIAPDGEALGTVFDDQATRNIVDVNLTGGRGASAPFVGHFQPEDGSLDAYYRGAVAGAANSRNSINGIWTLQVVDYRNSMPTTPNAVNRIVLNFSSGFDPGDAAEVTTTYTQGNITGTFPVASAAVKQGISPAPVIASDNTLGAYSPYQGRLYVAFVDRLRYIYQPADNTDVFLATSDDGGRTWTRSYTPVNDDDATLDGYSEGSSRGASGVVGQAAGAPGGDTGRPQFDPEVAVDSATGTLVLSWLDTRDDASRARVATYMTTSIDGGRTFSKDVFANDAQTATDADTGKTVVVGPIPDNESSGNPLTEGTVGFGSRIGLAVYAGHAYPIWASNQNGGGDAKELLDIRTRSMVYAAGPRIVASTQGPVGQPGDSVNNRRAADGGPEASAFQVTFDRPVDPSTFTVGDVTVLYHAATATAAAGTQVPVLSVVPVYPGGTPTPFGATTFQVNFSPSAGVGTYSYEIASADVRDRIRTNLVVNTPVGSPAQVASANVPLTVKPDTLVDSTVTLSGYTAGQVVNQITVSNVNITTLDAASVSIFLIAPDGTGVTLASDEPFPGGGGQNYAGTTFTDSAPYGIGTNAAPFTGQFKPLMPLNRFAGRQLNGTWRLEVGTSSTGFNATLTGWTLGVQAGVISSGINPGNKLDQNANGVAGESSDYYAAPSPTNDAVGGAFVGPFDPSTLPLVVPGPHIAGTHVAGAAATADGLVLNAAVGSVDLTFDRDMNPATVTPATVLRVIGPAGPIAGPFTVTPNPLGTDPNPSSPRTYRIGFPTQTLSGTYTVTLAASIADTHGDQLDINLNAGVALTTLAASARAATTPVSYNSTTPLTVAAGTTAYSTLTVPDAYLTQGLTVQINLTQAHDPDLQITLVAPDGTSVVLVPFGTGATGTQANFTNTVFDDSAASLIQNGGPPFFGRYKPSAPLSGLNGKSVAGAWKLFIDDNPATGTADSTLNGWTLTFQRPVTNTGLGEAVADQAQASFRVFTTDPTNRQSSTTWTAVGPTSEVGPIPGVAPAADPTANGFAGQVGAIAVDPTDPSGNTVFVGAASGGVWKTTDFLTTSPLGPTYVPLTDFGPTSGINIGSIAVFGRNNDPKQSIVIAGTGFADSSGGYGGDTSQGVGFLRSVDGGATWTLLDSTNNNPAFASRDHAFAANGGTHTYKVVVDPNPTPTGGVIVYAALGANRTTVAGGSTPAGGLWRSEDTGLTWTRVGRPTTDASDAPATDVTLDLNSAVPNAINNPTGNVNTIYFTYPGFGVYVSADRGNTANLMAGGGVDPFIVDPSYVPSLQIPVNNATAPVGARAGGKIVLARPALLAPTAPNADVENLLYESWLYAAVENPDGSFGGEYLTKDNGTTWTKLQLKTRPSYITNGLPTPIIPTNDQTEGVYDVSSNSQFDQSQYDLALAVDPLNPNLTYVGGTSDYNASGLVRVDATLVYDSHALLAYDNGRKDGGLTTINTTGRVTVKDKTLRPSGVEQIFPDFNVRLLGPYLNLTQDPTQPFAANTTVNVYNTLNFTNDGTGVRFTPIDPILMATSADNVPSTNVHRIYTEVDPQTGATRLIVGDDQGVFTAALNADGSVNPGTTGAPSATYSRNGNLDTAQFRYGNAQPSSALLNGQVASALYYGDGAGAGLVGSNPNVLSNGNLTGNGTIEGTPPSVPSITSADESGVGVGVDQQGNNVVYRYLFPGLGGQGTDFFQVSVGNGPFVSRTTGLVQTADDPQWPRFDANGPHGIGVGNFAVNPIFSDEVLISSATGNVFSTSNQGRSWQVLANVGSYAPALAYGAPDPTSPSGIGNLNNFLYAGTLSGHVFVSINGGTFGDNNAGAPLDGTPVLKIVPDPARGSHDAYAVTQANVFYNPNTVGGGAWVNITGNLRAITRNAFGDAATAAAATNDLTSLAVDFRYVIAATAKNGPAPNFPVVYVSGDSGVYRTLDNGTTWSVFPSTAVDGATADGGYLPAAHVTDLTISDGKVDPTTGRAVLAQGDPNTLLATTFGRGQFEIRLAPIVFAQSLAFDATLPAPNGSVSGTDSQGRPVVIVSQPVVDGASEQSAFGNTVYVTLLDETDPSNVHVIGGYDPTNPATAVAANQTDSAGRFRLQVNAGAFTSNGVKTIGVVATDASGSMGNTATLSFTLNASLAQPQKPAPPTLGLLAADDTSHGLNVTRVTAPRLTGATDPSVTVDLYNSVNGAPSGAALAVTASDGNGNFTFTYPASRDGYYTVVAVASNSYGSTVGKPFTFAIKTHGPTVAPVLRLSASTDTGIVGDGVTANHLPLFTGTAAPNSVVTIYQSVGGAPAGGALATTAADANGNFSVGLANALSDGSITLIAGEADVAGNAGPNGAALPVRIVTVGGDYLGNYKTTPAVVRRTASGGLLWVINGAPAPVQYGGSFVDVPFTGDFDGDGRSDLAVYRPSTNTWFLNRTSLGRTNFQIGAPGSTPVVGNFDGNGDTEAAVFQAGTGTWSIASTANGTETYVFAAGARPGDVPVPGNYAGEPYDALAVYRPSTGQFIIQAPGGAARTVALSTGAAGDVPVPGHYDDTATSKVDEPAVFNPSTGVYLIQRPGGVDRTVRFAPGDIPAPGDYDGTGLTEAAAYRPSINALVINGPGNALRTVPVGQAGDVPPEAPLAYRNVAANAPTIALAPGSDSGLVGDGVTNARRPFFVGATDANTVVNLIDASGAVVGSGASNASGAYAVQLSPNADLADGTYTVQARAGNLAGGVAPTSNPVTIRVVTVLGDYTGAGHTEPALFRRAGASALQWFVLNDAAVNGRTFGAGATAVPVTGDFTGGGRDDLAYYNPSTANWYIARPEANYAPQLLVNFGQPNLDLPVPGDYYGSGQTVAAVWRPTTGQWFIQYTAGAQVVVPALPGDVPVPGDYDGTGKDELAVYRPAAAEWFINGPNGTRDVFFGGPSFQPVPGAYDAGVGARAAEPAVYNPATGLFVVNAASGNRNYQFAKGDIPAPGDYDGIGRVEPAVFRPSTGQYYVWGPSDRGPRLLANFGGATDVPTLAPLSDRLLKAQGGTISAFSVPATSAAPPYDFGASARSLAAGAAASPSAAAAPPTAVVRARPAQQQHLRQQARHAALVAHAAAHRRLLVLHRTDRAALGRRLV